MLAEALIVLPVVTVLSLGVLEFGNVLWQRHQIETGVRDAARYWSRCRPDFGPCNLTTARNIAFYGNPSGTGAPRVPGWSQDSQLTIAPATPPGAPVASDVVTVTGTMEYQGSPLFNWLMIDVFTIEYIYSERYIGW